MNRRRFLPLPRPGDAMATAGPAALWHWWHVAGLACVVAMAVLASLASAQHSREAPAARLQRYEREEAARAWLIRTAVAMLQRQQARLATAGLANHPLAARLAAAAQYADGLADTLLSEQAAAAAEFWFLSSDERRHALDEIHAHTAQRLATLASESEVHVCDLRMAALTAGAARCREYLALVHEMAAAVQGERPEDRRDLARKPSQEQLDRAAALARQAIRDWVARLQSAAAEAQGPSARTSAALAAQQASALLDPAEVESLLAATSGDETQPLPAAAKRAWMRLHQLMEAAAEGLDSPQLAAALALERLVAQVRGAYEREVSLASLLDAALESSAGVSPERRRALIDRLVAEQADIHQLVLRLERPLADLGLQHDAAETAAATDACLQAAFTEQIAPARARHTEAVAAMARLVAACQSELDRALASLADIAVQPHPPAVPRPHGPAKAPTVPSALADPTMQPWARPFPPGYGDRLRRYFSNLPPGSR